MTSTKTNKKVLDIGQKLWVLLRLILLVGMAFLILKPFFVKIIMAFMLPDDLLDASVNLIPKHFSLYYWQSAIEGMNLTKTALNSLLLGVLVALTQLVVSALVGYGLARFRFRGHKLLFAFVIIIMLVPSSTYSIAQYLQFRYPFGLNLNMIDTVLPLFFMSLGGIGFKQGLYIYLFATFFRGLPKNLEDAAYVDGAGSFRTFCSIILPNSRAVIITVLIFSFSWQWTDVNYAQLYFNNLKVIPTAITSIFIRVGMADDPTGTAIARNAACILLILPLILLYLFGQKYLTQSISRTGMAN